VFVKYLLLLVELNYKRLIGSMGLHLSFRPPHNNVFSETGVRKYLLLLVELKYKRLIGSMGLHLNCRPPNTGCVDDSDR